MYGQPPYYNYGNGQNNGYVAPQQSQGFYTPAQQPQPTTIPIVPPKSNKILVTSLIDALNRTPEPNTDFIYIDQDNPFIYQVTIDMQGRKSYKTFEIKEVTEQQTNQSGAAVAPDIDLSAYATKEDLQALKTEIVNYAQSIFAAQPQTVSKPVSAEKTIKKNTDKE